MYKLLKIALLLIFAFAMEAVSAKIIHFNETIQDANGCRWNISGWVDVSLLPPGIDHWDVTMTSSDCDGSYHFVGIASPPGGGNGQGNQAGPVKNRGYKGTKFSMKQFTDNSAMTVSSNGHPVIHSHDLHRIEILVYNRLRMIAAKSK